jgi:hypothetical protein
LSDGSNPPNTLICTSTNTAGAPTTAGGTVNGWVMPGELYRVTTGGATLTNWIEWS